MEREILFRGKRRDNGKWWYGSYLFLHVPAKDWTGTERGPAEDVHFIVDETDLNYAVDSTTVGQYTGLTDKNGVKIFEGDVVSANNEICREVYKFLVKFGFCGGVGNADFPVGYPCFFFEEITNTIPTEFMMRKDPLYFLNAYECKVIGNIHNNPELLEETT